MIIDFVGIDGSGKSTLLSLFANYIEKTGKKVEIIKALNPNSIFMENYNILRNEFWRKHAEEKHEFNIITSYIMSFDLFQQSETIRTLDSDDKVILLDRWTICQQLYAKVWMAENEFSNTAYNMCLEPDISFVIDSEMTKIEQRLLNRGGANEFENRLSLRRLKKLYLKYGQNNENSVLIYNNKELDEALMKIIEAYEKKN